MTAVSLDRDPPARHLALVRWVGAQRSYELIFNCRSLPGAARLLARRARDYPGSTVCVLFCRRSEVVGKVAALLPPPFARQLPLFSEDR